MRFLKRWYTVLIIIPITVNVFTNTLSWNSIKSNSLISLFIVSVILNVILVGEFYIYYKNKTNLNYSIHHDKQIIERLFAVLNLKYNEWILKTTNHVDTLEYSYVNDLSQFLEQCEKLENHINDKIVNQKLTIFKTNLSNYLDLIASYMNATGENDFKVFSIPREFKENHYELYQNRIEQLDNSANNLYRALKEFFLFLKKKNMLSTHHNP